MGADLSEMEATISKILEMSLPEAMGKPDWRYIDLPRMPLREFGEFCRTAGPLNLEWITKATYGRGKSALMRGQVLVSPEGIRRLREAGSPYVSYGESKSGN